MWLSNAFKKNPMTCSISGVVTKWPFSLNSSRPFATFSKDYFNSEGLFCVEKVTVTGITHIKGQELNSSTLHCESIVCSLAR